MWAHSASERPSAAACVVELEVTPNPYTLNPTPYTLDPTPYTLDSKP